MTKPLLFVGDIHLGRTPHRLEHLAKEYDIDLPRLSPVEAWRRVVDCAIRREVQAVILAGDVVDSENDQFEAFAHLKKGVTDLVKQGIRVLGVAGNHDGIVLPKLSHFIPNFKLIGEGGHWERVELEGVDLIGWSFPNKHHSESPLLSDGLDDARNGRPGVCTIGIIHGDLDASTSKYAPIRRDQLKQLGFDAFFLGHIHKPDVLKGPRPIGYLGSLIGLGRGEIGPRGPWLVQPKHPSPIVEQLPLGPTHWLRVSMDLSTIDFNNSELFNEVSRRVAEEVKSSDWLQQGGNFLAVGITLELTGRVVRDGTPRQQVDDLKNHFHGAYIGDTANGIPWQIVDIKDRSAPAYDLNALAQAKTPTGQLARLLLSLEQDGASAIPPSVSHSLEQVLDARWCLDTEVPLEEHPRPSQVETTHRAATRLLEQLIDQGGAQ